VALPALVCVVALAVTAGAGSAPTAPAATYTVRVEIRDSACALSRRSVPVRSTVRFVVRNRTRTPKRFTVNRARTRVLARDKSQTLAVRFSRRGTFRFSCASVGAKPRTRTGTFVVTAVPPAAPPPDPPQPQPPPADPATAASLTQVGTFDMPVLVTAPSGGGRIFVVEQTGTVRVVDGGQILPRPFLDLRGRVTSTGESGLLSIAFAPDYGQSGLFYAFYNLPGGFGDIRISEFRRDPFDPDVADPSYERPLLTIPKPYENHNGGMLQFGPDGYLYASVGDGDPGVLNPPGFFAQRLDDLLGSILRIDPRGGDPYAIPADNPLLAAEGARPEIWAYGLRNPWRFWIDHSTGIMFIADVGSTAREEVNVVPPGRSGENFGWPCFEGTAPLDAPPVMCNRAVPPLLDFPRAGGVCAIIGGVVARDPRIPALAGRYLYGDLCTGRITAVELIEGAVRRTDVLEASVPGLSSFGVDGSGRIFVTSVGGSVLRVDPRT